VENVDTSLYHPERFDVAQISLTVLAEAVSYSLAIVKAAGYPHGQACRGADQLNKAMTQ
jgi:hypothetical protein